MICYTPCRSRLEEYSKIIGAVI